MRGLSRLGCSYARVTLVERYSYATLALVTLFMLAVGLWEIAAPFGAGHVAVLPARAIIADNMVTYGILYPVRAYRATVPQISEAYAHHPWGTYYLFALVRLLLGRNEWAIRLVPVAFAVAIPSLLFFVGSRVWGKASGALAALGWAVLPIVLAFAQFPSFEMFSIAGCLGACLSALRFHERPSRARLAELTCVTILAANTDWIASLFVFLVAITALVVTAYHVIRTRHVRVWLRPALGIFTCLFALFATLGVTLWFFSHAGLLGDFLGSADHRASGHDLPLLEVLRHRRYWIEIMFTKLGVALGVLGACVMVMRVLLLRKMVELVPLIFLLVSIFHYVHFKNGADVHIYWPLPFAVQFCLSLGVLGDSSGRLWNRLSPIISRQRTQAQTVPWGPLLVAFVALLNIPDALRALDYSRDSGARLNDDGQLNLQDFDKTVALTQFSRRMKPRELVMLHTSMQPNWSQDYALGRPTMIGRSAAQARAAGAKYLLFDLRYAPAAALTWATALEHDIVGPYLLVSTEKASHGPRGSSFRAREPSLIERYFEVTHDPIWRIEADPGRDWELREHLRVTPNPVPVIEMRPENLRSLHNIAVSQNNAERVTLLRAEIERNLERSSARRYLDGTRLLGHRLSEGTPSSLDIYFVAANPLGNDVFFDVRSQVLSAPALSFVVADDKEKRYGTGFEIHPALFRPGFIYVSHVEVRERPGRERFYGQFIGSLRPRVEQGSERVVFFERP